MKGVRYFFFLLSCLVTICACGGCARQNNSAESLEEEKDFSMLDTPESQEEAYTYSTYFLPSAEDSSQAYVGDPMPYYEDGIYYMYYLKEGGDSYNHSIYLVTTKDFITYSEQKEPVLEASSDLNEQDSWVGTGSVIKVDKTYYLFYTGHTASSTAEFKEKIMVAKSDNLYSFEKVTGWEIVPDDELRQKNDFRDPQAYFDSETGMIDLTVTASQDGVARILKYSLAVDLSSYNYDGVIFTNAEGNFWNLECSDTFRLGDTWYLTYSAQDDTLWYATSEHRYGPYSAAKRLEGRLFYAAKHVEDGENSYMVGWARRAEPVSSNLVEAWAGNLVVQKLVQKENADLVLAPVDSVVEQYKTEKSLLAEKADFALESSSLSSYCEVFSCYESFLIKGEFTYSGSGSFGLYFDYDKEGNPYKTISINSSENVIQLYYNEGKILTAESEVNLQPNQKYSFTYVQEGSVGVFYVNDEAALTVRIYGASGKAIHLFAENTKVEFSSLQEWTK